MAVDHHRNEVLMPTKCVKFKTFRRFALCPFPQLKAAQYLLPKIL
jgi:hypothetical protein